MKEKNVSLRKIERMAILAFKNALRLHFDSTVLVRRGSIPSAYFLSILALEELGKHCILEHFIYHSTIDGRYEPAEEHDWIQMVYHHRVKQLNFFIEMGFVPYAEKAMKDVSSGKMEVRKQDAVYVGLQRKKGKIDLHGKIRSPFAITKRMAEKQITLVNDTFLLYASGTLKGFYMPDIDGMHNILTHSLIRKLKKAWPLMRPSVRRRYEKLMTLPDDKDE